MSGYEEWFAPEGGMTSVKGFISQRAATAITALLKHQEKANVRGSIAEIGTYVGKTFIGLMKAARYDERAVAVDVFPHDMQDEFNDNLNRHRPIEAPGIQVLKADSATITAQAWATLLGSPARFVHVDGNHTRDAVRNDIGLAGSHLAPGGVVLIDDFLHEWYPEVTFGIFHALAESKAIAPVCVIPRSGPIHEGGTKLLCARPEDLQTYLGVIRDAFPGLVGHIGSIGNRSVYAFHNRD